MKISILDASTISMSDLSWDTIHKLGNCEIFPSTSADQIYKKCKDTDIIIANKVAFGSDILNKLPKLKLICVTATGVNQIDLKAAKELNIKVSNVPNYSTYSVSQMVFAHILNFTQHVSEHSTLIKKGEWQKRDSFCFWNSTLLELSNLNLGILGFGNIGKTVANIGKSFGMNILIHTRHPKEKEFPFYQFVELEDLFKRSDFISLHCPLTNKTDKIINDRLLKLMKKTAFLINTSRGGLIDEQALSNVLNNNLIKGAGLDVLSTEPPKENNPLLKSKNTTITPHIAWATLEARQRVLNETAKNIESFLKEEDRNIVI